MFNLGIFELVFICFIVLVVFGVGRLPELGSGLGKGIKNFKDSLKGEKDNIEDKSSE